MSAKPFLTHRFCDYVKANPHSTVAQIADGLNMRTKVDIDKVRCTANNLICTGHVSRHPGEGLPTYTFNGYPCSPTRPRRKAPKYVAPEKAVCNPSIAPSRQPTPFVPLQRDPFAMWHLCLRDLPETSQSAARRYVIG